MLPNGFFTFPYLYESDDIWLPRKVTKIGAFSLLKWLFAFYGRVFVLVYQIL